jgi:outer membrane protein insertion porin family
MMHLVRLPGLGLSRAALLAGLLASAAVMAPPAAFAQSYSFSSVAVEGNQRIEPRTILNFARIPRAQAVSAAELNDAYQRLMGSGLFEEVTITPRGGRLVIAVKEYPTVNIVNFEGNRLLKTEELSQLIESRSRRVFSPTQAEADAAAIAEVYAQRGRLAARVEPRIIRRSDNRVDLVFEIAEGRVTEVERLSFVGNRAFSDRRLRQVLETKQAGLLRQLIARDTYAAERIDMDKQLLRDFYQSRGFIDAQVVDATAELARERDGFFVTFTVREGLQYRFGNTRVVSEIEGVESAAYEQLVRLRPGTIYTPSDVEGVIARMEALASRQGVNFLRVEPRIKRNDRDQTLDIDFALVRGERIFVERIDIEGNTTTADQVIRRQFSTVEGDPLNPRDIRRAAERIRALGFFEQASVEATEGSTPEAVVVKTTVTEKPTGSLSFGASYGKADGIGFSVGLSESNFLGRGQFVSVDLNLGASNATSSFTFAEPALLGRDLRLSFSGLLAETEANYATWDTRLAQLGVGLEFPLSESLRMETRLTLNKSRVSNVAATSSPILAREAARGSLFGAGLGYTLNWDNRRTGLAGDTAVVLRFGQDLYGLGGDLRYLKSELFAGAQTRVLSGDVVLRAEVEGGVVAAAGGRNTRVTERFFLDGKMRGFQPFGVGPRDTAAGKRDPLGGNVFAVARFEAEFPLGLPEEYGIRGGAFFDIGSVWGLDDVAGVGPVDDKMRLRSSVGVSLLWDTPIGPLRFNFSKALKKQAYDREQSFDLTISTKF